MAGLFYVDELPDVGELAIVDGDLGFHAVTVRRIRTGEELTLGDGSGGLARCAAEVTGRGLLHARVLDRWDMAAPTPPVTVVQALPKSERSELAIELATEAGADAFVAWQAERCVARWEGSRVENGLRRWRAVARAAAGQSRRAHIPAVAGLWSTAQLADWVAERTTAGTTVLTLHESATVALADAVTADATALALLVGPEGGITEPEIAELSAAGAVTVRLGPTVLRTSTAATVALGALGVLTGRWA